MPILPFIEDTEENITNIVEAAHKNGASYFIPWFGMSLRDRQRAYYYAQLDRLFPGLRQRYERTYGDRYDCPVPNADSLARLFYELCERYGIAAQITPYEPQTATQLSLL
jgi:hypothetical protein